MAKKTKEKYDLETLAIKQKLIGANIHFEDGVSPDIKNWYKDGATQEIHLEFVDGTGVSLDLRKKFVVDIEDTYESVQPKKKNKKPKRNK